MTLNRIFAGMMPFMVIQILAMVVIYLFPQMVYFFPDLIYGARAR